jgi:hypothetical protein
MWQRKDWIDMNLTAGQIAQKIKVRLGYGARCLALVQSGGSGENIDHYQEAIDRALDLFNQYVNRKERRYAYVGSPSGEISLQTESSYIDLSAEEGLLGVADVEFLPPKDYSPIIDISIFNLTSRLLTSSPFTTGTISANRIGPGTPQCLTKDTKIPLLDGTERTIEELFDYAGQIWLYSYDHQRRKIVPGKAGKPFRSGINVPVFKVILDNGMSEKVTPDHLWLMKNREYKATKDLQPGDSLMPLYRRMSAKQENGYCDGYEEFLDPTANKWEFTHKRVAEFVNRSATVDENNKLVFHGGIRGSIRHHLDFNKRNNRPDNLVWMVYEDHLQFHSQFAVEHMAKLWSDPEYVAKMATVNSEVMTKLCQDSEFVKARSEGGRRYWDEEGGRERQSKRMVERHKDPIFQLNIAKGRDEFWDDPNNVQLFKDRMKRRHREDEKYKAWCVENARKLATTPAVCDICGEICFNVGHLAQHKKRYHGDPEPVICPICSRDCENKGSLVVHMKSAHGEHTPATCEICGKVCKNEMGLQRHHRTVHVGHKETICDICGTVCNSEAGLKRHKQNSHGKVEYQICFRCGKKCKKGRGYKTHMIRTHGINQFQPTNHKVVSVEFVGYEDVYDLTVPEYHNFAVSSGVFVHNTTLPELLAQRKSVLRARSLEPDWIFDPEKKWLVLWHPASPYHINYILSYQHTITTLPQTLQSRFLDTVEAYCRLTLADILGTFGNEIPGPTGPVQMDVEAMRTRGDAMLTKIEAYLKSYPFTLAAIEG